VKSTLRAVVVGSACVLVSGALAACSTPSAPLDASDSAISSRASATSSSPAVAANVVTLNGVSVTLPAGWFETAPGICGTFAEHSVTPYRSPQPVAACPALLGQQTDAQSIQLVALFGPWGSYGWSGARTTWHGQPAWVTTVAANGKAPVPGTDQPVTTSIALPWLNAMVVVRAADRVATDELLAHVTVQQQTVLGVPASASKVRVAFAVGASGGTASSVPGVINGLLADLRALPSLAAAQACRPGGKYPGRVSDTVLTFTTATGNVSYLVSAISCNQVTAGAGSAGKADAVLRRDVARLAQPSLR
jgi:hypothetical protein